MDEVELVRVTAKEAARILGRSEKRVFGMCAEGKLESEKVGRTRFVLMPRAQVETKLGPPCLDENDATLGETVLGSRGSLALVAPREVARASESPDVLLRRLEAVEAENARLTATVAQQAETINLLVKGQVPRAGLLERLVRKVTGE